ncbi:cation/H(+) antiporter 4-like [Coffea arabica]|uniref:Cation/H(+) antiporter 4-like n=1 Tax=Coffea arabica TaxID=13443 RepID=A0ABM4U638_COFAR
MAKFPFQIAGTSVLCCISMLQLHPPSHRYEMTLDSAGLILGSTFLGRDERFQKFLFPAKSQGTLGAFTSFGYLLFQFMSGVKMDTGMIRKTGPKALAIGVLNLVVPLVAGGIAMLANRSYNPNNAYIGDQIRRQRNRYGILVAQSMTAFPVIALLLKDLKILNTELGRLAMSSGLITHLLQVAITSVNTIWFSNLKNKQDYNQTLDSFLCMALVILIIFIIRPALLWVVQQTPKGRPVNDLYIFFVILLCFVSGVFSYYLDVGVLFGPFIVGLAIPEGPPLGSALVDKLDTFSSGVLLPTFITLVTLRTSLSALAINKSSIVSIVLMVVPFASKIIVCSLVARYCKMPLNDSIALGLIMSIKGVVDLATYSFIRDQGIIDQTTFALLVISTAAIAMFVPSMVQLLYDPSRKYASYQKRNIMHSRHGGKLPILACIHSSDNIVATIKLLDASTPTVENPIVVHALHLIELRGRASPIFISHQVHKRTDISYSENVIHAFKQFERNNWGSVAVQAFTAISPRNLMHEDICTLALDVLASLIIVPFHRKWGIDGSVESEDQCLRMVNRNVLDRAPCSVGILVDRGHLGRSGSMTLSVKAHFVAVIFLGGKDDQEALTLAKRMTRNENVNLTVMRYISKGRDGSDMEDDMNDMKVLYDFKQNRVGQGNVTYIEKVVNDCPELVQLVRSMADQYDLILVGRRYNKESTLTRGLEEWSEVPEIGVIGDLLASSDVRRRASVLVVQQQLTTY